jgi:hypothetical protein
MTDPTRFEALVGALCLALVAPDEEQAARAATLAEALAAGMEPAEVECAKAQALERTR